MDGLNTPGSIPMGAPKRFRKLVPRDEPDGEIVETQGIGVNRFIYNVYRLLGNFLYFLQDCDHNFDFSYSKFF